MGDPMVGGTTTAPSATTDGQPELFQGLRRDLQGVRGLGISLVVIGHLFLVPHGVFAALDIFFVLSGYLITGLLVRQLPEHGVKTFAVFYASRARRLLPMALLVLAVTTLLTFGVYSTSRGREVLEDAGWAAIFGVNWHFATDGTDYFSPSSQSPLLHYWSLSVEEQFYLVWPVLLLGAIAFATARRVSRTAAIGVVMTAVVVVSFGYSLWHSQAEPLASYFSTFDRAWEFGAGGLLALAAPWLVRIPRGVRRAGAWLAAPGIFGTIFLLDPSVAFPAPWGLLPVAMTALVIVGGLEGDTGWLWLVDNRLMVYLGDISYSLYLVHLPVNVLLIPFFDEIGPTYYATALVLAVVLGMLGYHAVERPLRRAPWLRLPAERRLRPAPPKTREKRPAWQTQLIGWGVIGGFMALVMVVGLVLRGPGADTTVAADPDATTSEELGHEALLRRALEEPVFPEQFDPPLAELRTTSWQEEQAATGCGSVPFNDLDACRFGDGERTVAVFGDSVAASWMPTVREAFEPAGWSVQQLTLEQCGTWELPSYIRLDGTVFNQCNAWHERVREYLAETPPDLLIMASATEQVRNAERPDIDATGRDVAEEGLSEALSLVPDDIEVLVLAPPPQLAYLVECVSRVGTPLQCAREPNEAFQAHDAGERAAVEGTDATYLATESWFCVDGSCPGYVGNTPVTMDGTHLTVEYAETLAPLMVSALPQWLEDEPDPAPGEGSDAGDGSDETLARR